MDDGGNAHKKREHMTNIYYWLERHNYPPGFQVLCMNCQWIKKAENNENKGCGWRLGASKYPNADSVIHGSSETDPRERP